MATTKKAKTSTTQTLLVYLGDTGLEVGELQFSRQGQKEVSAFRYSSAWLRNPDCFALSPDLPLSTDFQYRAGSKEASTFAGAIADTEPDGWGRRVIVFVPQSQVGHIPLDVLKHFRKRVDTLPQQLPAHFVVAGHRIEARVARQRRDTLLP